jgi:diguanylate cyclase
MRRIETRLNTHAKTTSGLRALGRLFGGRRGSASVAVRNELLMTEYAQLQRQVPALYATIAVANVATTATIQDAAPSAYWMIAPAILTLVIIGRLLLWAQRRNRIVALEDVRKRVKGTTITAIGLASVAGLWTVQAFFEAPGTLRLLLPICTLLSAFAVVNCLSSLRLAATVVLGLGAMPVITAMLFSGERIYFAVGSCALVVALLQLRLIAERYRHNLGRIEMQHKMKQLANTDMLTNLPNRRSFFAEVERCLQRENGTRSFAVALLDLDGFKQINDRLGHQAGDRLLQAVAERLSQHVNATTTFGRIGGDEFAILFDVAEPLATVSARATGIMASLAEPCIIAGRRIAISASLGIAQFPSDGRTLGDLFLTADKALYAAKSEGRTSVQRPLATDSIRASAA